MKGVNNSFSAPHKTIGISALIQEPEQITPKGFRLNTLYISATSFGDFFFLLSFTVAGSPLCFFCLLFDLLALTEYRNLLWPCEKIFFRARKGINVCFTAQFIETLWRYFIFLPWLFTLLYWCDFLEPQQRITIVYIQYICIDVLNVFCWHSVVRFCFVCFNVNLLVRLRAILSILLQFQKNWGSRLRWPHY